MSKLTEEVRKAIFEAAVGEGWKLETVSTSIGSCHKIMPLGACIYDDGRFRGESSVLLKNALLIANAPSWLEQLCDRVEQLERESKQLRNAILDELERYESENGIK